MSVRIMLGPPCAGGFVTAFERPPAVVRAVYGGDGAALLDLPEDVPLIGEKLWVYNYTGRSAHLFYRGKQKHLSGWWHIYDPMPADATVCPRCDGQHYNVGSCARCENRGWLD